MKQIRHLLWLVVAATLMVSTTVLAPPMAHADPTGRMMLVLDSSGSMKETTSGGLSKIDAAKKSLSSVINSMPVDTAVGLRVFGAKVENRSDAGACTDSQLVVPVGTNNKAALQSAVSSYKPYGETPIGFALQEAAKDLGPKGRRSIVLVSDGEATCAPDPCTVAEQVAKTGIDIRIDVVGLSVDPKTRQQLQCIATKGKGKYYDADNADQLAQALEETKTQVSTKTVAKQVKGTPTVVGAPSIQVGDWVDTIGGIGTKEAVKYYQLHRTIEGSSIEASVMNDAQLGVDEGLKVELVQGDYSCSTGDSGPKANTYPFRIAAARVPQAANERCVNSADLVLRVTRTGSGTKPQRMQIRVLEIPPVVNLPDVAEPPEYKGYDAPLHSAPIKFSPASTVADAPVLPSGKTIAGALKPGMVLIMKVPVGWGQRFAAAIQVPKVNAQVEQASKDHELRLFMTVLDPAGGSKDGAELSPSSYDSQASVKLQPVNIKRGIKETYVSSSDLWLAGYYTVIVTLQGQPGTPNVEVPFQLTTEAVGETGVAPKFGKKDEIATPTPTPEPTETAQPTETATAPESPAASASPAAGGGERGKRSPVLPLLLGLAGGGLVAGGAVWLLRRKNATGGAHQASGVMTAPAPHSPGNAPTQQASGAAWTPGPQTGHPGSATSAPPPPAAPQWGQPPAQPWNQSAQQAPDQAWSQFPDQPWTGPDGNQPPTGQN